MNDSREKRLAVWGILSLVGVIIAAYMYMTTNIGANPENLIMQARATWVAIMSLVFALVTVLTIVNKNSQ